MKRDVSVRVSLIFYNIQLIRIIVCALMSDAHHHQRKVFNSILYYIVTLHNRLK